MRHEFVLVHLHESSYALYSASLIEMKGLSADFASSNEDCESWPYLTLSFRSASSQIFNQAEFTQLMSSFKTIAETKQDMISRNTWYYVLKQCNINTIASLFEIDQSYRRLESSNTQFMIDKARSCDSVDSRLVFADLRVCLTYDDSLQYSSVTCLIIF